MPKGVPAKGWRASGGGRKKNTCGGYRLVVVGKKTARSRERLQPQIQAKLRSMSDDAIERVVDFLAPELGDKIDEDILEIDLGKLSWTRLKALASLCFETLSQRKSSSK